MKKRIALLVAVTMVAVMILSMGTAFAASKTISLFFVDYYTGEAITGGMLPTTATVTDVDPLYYSEITLLSYNVMGVKDNTPSVVTYADGYTSMTVRVASKNASNYYPYPTYYYGYNYNYNGQMLTLGFGDYVYGSIEAANPLAAIPAGSSLLVTSLHLGSLSPNSSHVTFGTSNSTVASTVGPLIMGNYPGTAKLYVYYDGNMIITKDIIVTSSSYPTYTNSGSIVAADDNLVIGPATFNALKGKSYKFKSIKLNGSSISATSLRWESSNTSIATVSKSGVVRTRKAGTVVITAETTDGENSASIDFVIR